MLCSLIDIFQLKPLHCLHSEGICDALQLGTNLFTLEKCLFLCLQHRSSNPHNKHGKNVRSCNWQVAGEICIVRNWIICVCQRILLWLSLCGKWDRWEMQHTYGIWGIPTAVLLREETTGRLIIDGMVILKLLSRKGVWGFGLYSACSRQGLGNKITNLQNAWKVRNFMSGWAVFSF